MVYDDDRDEPGRDPIWKRHREKQWGRVDDSSEVDGPMGPASSLVQGPLPPSRVAWQPLPPEMAAPDERRDPESDRDEEEIAEPNRIEPIVFERNRPGPERNRPGRGFDFGR